MFMMRAEIGWETTTYSQLAMKSVSAIAPAEPTFDWPNTVTWTVWPRPYRLYDGQVVWARDVTYSNEMSRNSSFCGSFSQASACSERQSHCWKETRNMVANKAAVIVCCLLVLCSTLAAGTIITVEKCPKVEAVEGKLISVDLTPCPSQPCVFHRGTNVSATIKFSPDLMVPDGTLEVFGIIGGIQEPFPLVNPDACKDHGLVCPLKSGVPYGLEINLPIKPYYPTIQLVARMDFKLSDGKYLFCFIFPMQIAEWGVGVERSNLRRFELSDSFERYLAWWNVKRKN